MTSPSLEPRADDGGPAFPVPTTTGMLGTPEPSAKAGMTLLDWFAGQMACGLSQLRISDARAVADAGREKGMDYGQSIARTAYAMASDLIAEKRSREGSS